jgi:hypothetical protein
MTFIPEFVASQPAHRPASIRTACSAGTVLQAYPISGRLLTNWLSAIMSTASDHVFLLLSRSGDFLGFSFNRIWERGQYFFGAGSFIFNLRCIFYNCVL